MSTSEAPDLTPPRPDDLLHLRLGRLLLLLEQAAGKPRAKSLDLERLSTYDFFADNPLLVFEDGSVERRRLLLAGYQATSLSYHSAAQRFTNRRARIQHDLAHLLAHGLVRAQAASSRVSYELSDEGAALAGRFVTAYADAYRLGADLVVARLNRLSDRELRTRAAEWTRAEPFLIDIHLELASQTAASETA